MSSCLTADGRLGSLDFVRQALGGLGHGVQVSGRGIPERVRTHEGIAATGGVLLDTADALQDLKDLRAVHLHTGCASRRTSSRMNGFKLRSVTTSIFRTSSASRSSIRPAGNHADVGPGASTRRAMSDCRSSSPRNTDPKIRTFVTPCFRANSSISERCCRTASRVVIDGSLRASPWILADSRPAARRRVPAAQSIECHWVSSHNEDFAAARST